MTKNEARAEIRALGLAVSIEDGEYRVTFRATDMHDPDQRERVAYYTNDPQDAVDTARQMAREIGNAW